MAERRGASRLSIDFSSAGMIPATMERNASTRQEATGANANPGTSNASVDVKTSMSAKVLPIPAPIRYSFLLK